MSKKKNFTIDILPISEAFVELGKAMTAMAEQIAVAFGVSLRILNPGEHERMMQAKRERERIARLLDIDNDENAPGWIKDTHKYQIDTFGSGNGRKIR